MHNIQNIKFAGRLAIVVSHPIQHFVHLYRALAKIEGLKVKVFFCSKIGAEGYFDNDMNTIIQWAGDMTGGFEHVFLPEAAKVTNTNFFSVNNPSIAGELKEFGPDAVIVYGYAQLTQIRALIWCWTKGCPVLMITDSNAVTTRSLVKTLLRQLILRILLSRVSGFLTVGDQNEQLLEGLGVRRTQMYRSPFPIDEERYRLARDARAAYRVEIRRQYDIPDDAFVGISVGKLIKRKRTEDAVRAFSKAATAVGPLRPLHLLICGDGPDFQSIQALAQDLNAPVTLAGFINVDILPKFFCAADVLIHPAQRDAHPLICSEAASIGLPMILSNLVGTIGPTDVCRPDRNALVVPCGDVAPLAASIIRLATDQRLWEEMSAASLDIFEQCALGASIEGLMRAVEAVTARCYR